MSIPVWAILTNPAVREASDSESQEESLDEEQQSDLEEESSADEDEEPLPAIRPYAALMQSLSSDAAPQSKRRKLDHASDTATSKRENLTEQDDQGSVAEDADQVEEPEEGPETATDDLLEEVEEDVEDSSDPFEAHFADPDDNVLAQRLKAIQQNQWISHKLQVPKVGKAVLSLPHKDSTKHVSMEEISGPGQLKLKQKLATAMLKHRSSFDELERQVSPIMFNYQDMLFCERKTTNSESLRRLACLHAVNHVFK